MTDLFLFARLNLPNVLISIPKKFFHSVFPSTYFDVPKASNFTSGGVKNRETKNRTGNDCDVISGLQASRKTDFSDIYLFSYKQRTIVSFLSELISSHRKWLRNLFFARSGVLKWRHNRSQSPGRKIANKKFFSYTISTLRRFNRANKKKKSVIYTLNTKTNTK